MITFTAASLACALAPDSQVLVAFRFIQGAGAAAAVPQVFSIIQLTFTGQARAKALSAYAAVLSAGAVAGLVLGGVVVTADLFGASWRPVFAINVPAGILLAVLVPRLVPADQPRATEPRATEPRATGPRATGPRATEPRATEPRATEPRAAHRPGRVDLAGLMIAVPAVLLIVLPLVLGREAGWPAWCFAGLAMGVVLAVVFVLAERRVAARGGDPLLNLDVLRAPALPSGLAALALTQVAYGGLLFAFTLYLQLGLGQSALRAGLTYLPMAAAFGLAGFYWRRLPPRARRIVIPVGLTVSAAGYLGLAASLRGGVPGQVWAWPAVVGAGLGLSVSPLLTQSLVHVPAARAADASGLLTTTVQLGQLLGVTVIGSVYLSRAAAAPGADSRAMSVAACWLAALSAAGLLAALIMLRAARPRR